MGEPVNTHAYCKYIGPLVKEGGKGFMAYALKYI